MGAVLTVVIPSRNAQNLASCIEAIRAVDQVSSIVVVDDGLPLGAYGGGAPAWWPRSARSRTPIENVRMIAGVKPFIFARNANLGIREAAGDVVLLNDDAVLCRGDFFTLLAWQAIRPEFGILLPAVLGPSNSREHAPRLGTHGVREAQGKTVPFVCVFLPRSTIERVGELDERFDCYGGDDDDYCYRVRQAGLKIGIVDECVVDHAKLKSTFRPDGRGLPIAAARQLFFEKHGFEMGTR